MSYLGSFFSCLKLPFMALVSGLRWSSMGPKSPPIIFLPIWIHLKLFRRKGDDHLKIQFFCPQPLRMSRPIGSRFGLRQWFIRSYKNLLSFLALCSIIIILGHLLQTILYLPDPIEVKQDQTVEGSVTVSQSKENPRFLNIHLECS